MVQVAMDIGNFMLNAFSKLWPYLVLTIPLAVLINVSGASKYIKKAFVARPLVAILLATIVGAFSPFCSCGVVPVIASLLIGGVPIAPVMAFWLASPSMDPEVFFLSVATIGWELAVWRLVGTFGMSLMAGYLTHWVMVKGYFGKNILRRKTTTGACGCGADQHKPVTQTLVPQPATPLPASVQLNQGLVTAQAPAMIEPAGSCGCYTIPDGPEQETDEAALLDSIATGPEATPGQGVSLWSRLVRENWSAGLMVFKFMALAFFLEAIIILYVPTEFISGLLGGNGFGIIFTSVLIGVPVYTTNLTALGLVGGLLEQGMNPGAALAFLVAGATTTLPAMAAVWGITSKRVFFLYVAFTLAGALVVGILYQLVFMF